MKIDILQAHVAAAAARLHRIDVALRNAQNAVDELNVNGAIGALLIAQDELGPMTTLVEAAVLLGKYH